LQADSPPNDPLNFELLDQSELDDYLKLYDIDSQGSRHDQIARCEAHARERALQQTVPLDSLVAQAQEQYPRAIAKSDDVPIESRSVASDAVFPRPSLFKRTLNKLLTRTP